MDDYKPNSYKVREARKNASEKDKVEKVVTGKVKAKKKSGMNKMTEALVSEDIKNVKSYVVMDVLIPALKKAISDVVTNGVDMILYGETGRSKRGSNASYVSYNRYSDKRDDRYSATRTRTGYSYDDIIIESRGEAEEVLTRMDELLETYGVVSVADLYDLVGITGNYTDNKYGWTNIRNAQVVRVRDGYLLKLPKALPID